MAYLGQCASVEVKGLQNVGHHGQHVAEHKNEDYHHQHDGQVLLLIFFQSIPLKVKINLGNGHECDSFSLPITPRTIEKYAGIVPG